MPTVTIDFEMDDLDEQPISVVVARPGMALMFMPDFDPDPGEEVPEEEELIKTDLRAVVND